MRDDRFPIDVLLETADWLVLNKPVGLATQAPSGIDSLEFRVRRYLGQGDSGRGPVYVGVPHRLDRPASGAIVLARTKPAARDLAAQFRLRQVRKKYWALVEGTVGGSEGTWSDWMRKLPDEPRSVICGENDPGAQGALLSWRKLQSRGNRTLLEIVLETGRSHQIRLQTSSRGFPISGDQQYGSSVAFGPPVEDERLAGIGLHARELAFKDPATGKDVEVIAPVPGFWSMQVSNGGG